MSDKQLLRIFIILSFCLAIVMRLALLDWELPYYSIDENDVVEPALAFLSGDWDPHWYKYGPLFSYFLAFIFKFWKVTASIVLGWTNDDFFYYGFFEPTSFYILARAFHAFIIIVIAIVSCLYAQKNYDRQTALVALFLGLAPFLDIITNFTVRVDTLLGLFSLVSLFFATQFGRDRVKFRPYILSGIFAGLCIATKPLPGLLLLPALVFGHVLTVWQATNSSAKRTLKFVIVHPNLWILVGSIILVHSLANPYSIIKFKPFLLEQYKLIFSGAEQGGKYAGYDFSRLVSLWSWPMVIAMTAGLLTAWRWSDNASRILLVYTITFLGVFLVFKTRLYWYNAVFPAVFLIVARFVSRLSKLILKYIFNLQEKDSNSIGFVKHLRCRETLIMVFLTTILMFFPLLKTGHQAWGRWSSPVPPLEKRADRAAQLWIESNLSAHSPILLIGYYPFNLPRILADTARSQADWGEYFMYYRRENLPWVEAFKNAYRRLQQTGQPTYQLVNIREHFSDDNSDPKLNSLFRKDLVNYARQNGFKYLVTASPKSYKGIWEKDMGVKILSIFNRESGHTGSEVKIFEVLP